MICKHCNKDIPQTAGKRAKVYCNDSCKQAYHRAKRNGHNVTDNNVTHNVTRTDLTGCSDEEVLDELANPTPYYATRTNPELLNWGKHMTAAELEQSKYKANRVPIPGDYDYTGYIIPKGEDITTLNILPTEQDCASASATRYAPTKPYQSGGLST